MKLLRLSMIICMSILYLQICHTLYGGFQGVRRLCIYMCNCLFLENWDLNNHYIVGEVALSK